MTHTLKNTRVLVSHGISKSAKKLYPWLIISLCALFLFYKYVLQVSPSVMTNALMAEFNITGVGLGNLAATYFYAYLIVQLLIGPLLDKFSPRYLTTLAIFICALGAFVFANTHTLYMAQVARALMGAGTAFATVSYMKMSATWFRADKVAFVDGFVATAAMLGALCGQVPLSMLVMHAGWRESLNYCGLFGVIFAGLFWVFVRDNNPAHTKRHEPTHSIKLRDVLALLKDKKNWLLTFYSGLAFTPIAVLGGLWGNPFFEVMHHLSPTQAAYYSSLIFLGLAFGGPIFGILAGRLQDYLPIMQIGTLVGFLSLVIVMYVVALPLWLFALLLFIFGLGTGVFILSFPLAKSLNSLGLAGTIVALINTGDALFGSFTEPLVGHLLDKVWDGKILHGAHYFSLGNYHLALSILPIYLLAAYGCLVYLGRLKDHR